MPAFRKTRLQEALLFVASIFPLPPALKRPRKPVVIVSGYCSPRSTLRIAPNSRFDANATLHRPSHAGVSHGRLPGQIHDPCPLEARHLTLAGGRTGHGLLIGAAMTPERLTSALRDWRRLRPSRKGSRPHRARAHGALAGGSLRGETGDGGEHESPSLARRSGEPCLRAQRGGCRSLSGGGTPPPLSPTSRKRSTSCAAVH